MGGLPNSSFQSAKSGNGMKGNDSVIKYFDREEVKKMPIIRKIVRSDCAACKREGYCYFGVAFNSFPALSRVVFEDAGFTSCWKAENNTAQKDEE